MGRFIEGESRTERLLLPDCLDDDVGEDKPVRVVDAFIGELDLPTLGFASPAATGRPPQPVRPSNPMDYCRPALSDNRSCDYW
jgi:hypothetical protein